MSEHGYVGWGNKIHLIKEHWPGDRSMGDSLCGQGGYIHSTSDPVDCKLCLRRLFQLKNFIDKDKAEKIWIK